jgi:hypothetical protein
MTKLWTVHESVMDERTEPITLSPFFLRKGGGQLKSEHKPGKFLKFYSTHANCLKN